MTGERRVLVTGAGGFVGTAVVRRLRERSLAHARLRHTDDIDDAPWDSITHVVNCAALLPTAGATLADYLSANVRYPQRLMAAAVGTHLIHFGTRSQYYRLDDYQVTKMLGCAMVLENAGAFRAVDVVMLPTLDDEALVAGLVARAERGEAVTVDRLRYEYCDRGDVARHVVDGLIEGDDVPMRVEQRDLYERVSRASAAPVSAGRSIDRVCRDADGLTVLSSEL